MKFVVILAAVVLAGLACGPNQRILESSDNRNESPVPVNSSVAPTVSTFEQDLNAMRNADFKFIVAFRRRDGGPMDASDKELISRNTGPQANRRRLSDDGKAVIIGSNFPFQPGTFEEMSKRFSVENYSKPDSGPMISNSSPSR
jgi:hypothetical protein